MTFLGVLRYRSDHLEGAWIKRSGWTRYIWVSRTTDVFTANVGVVDFLANDWERKDAEPGDVIEEDDESAERFSLLELD